MFPRIGGKPPKSSILIGFSIVNHPFWGFSPYSWKHPVVDLPCVLLLSSEPSFWRRECSQLNSGLINRYESNKRNCSDWVVLLCTICAAAVPGSASLNCIHWHLWQVSHLNGDFLMWSYHSWCNPQNNLTELTLPETNSLHLKIGRAPKGIPLCFQPSIFRCENAVSFRELSWYQETSTNFKRGHAAALRIMRHRLRCWMLLSIAAWIEHCNWDTPAVYLPVYQKKLTVKQVQEWFVPFL